MDNLVSTCGEIIVETKTIPTNFDEKMHPVKHKISIFYSLFINYCSFIDSC